jgi:hypothetical protein
MMNRLVRGLLLAALLVGVTGCTAPGLIYTDIVRPLDLDLHETPDKRARGRSGTKAITLYNISVIWDSAAIADAARQRGLTKIYYADMRTVSVWFGIWQQRTAIVYGE